MRNNYGLRAVVVMLLLALGCKVGLAQIGPRYVLEVTPVPVPPKAAIGAGAAGSVRLAGKGLALIRFQGLEILTVGADADGYSAEAVPGWPAADLLLVTPAGAGRYAGLAPLSALSRLPVIVAEQGAGTISTTAAADRPQFYPMQTWDALHLRKGKTRLRVTALPGQPGTAQVAGFMLEVGDSRGRSSYRLYISCDTLEADEIGGLSRRLPGADLAVLPGRDAPQLLVLGRGGAHPAAVESERKPAALTTAGYAFTPVRR